MRRPSVPRRPVGMSSFAVMAVLAGSLVAVASTRGSNAPTAAPGQVAALRTSASAAPTPATATGTPSATATSTKPSAPRAAAPTASAPAATTRTSAPAVVSRYAPGTSVSSATSQQVMVVTHTSGTTATWARYQWTGTGWVKVNGYASVATGVGGMTPGNRRVEGDHSTPIGTFGIVYEFGQGLSGVRMPYRVVDACSWWIESPGQPDYNRWRQDCHLTGQVATDSEHLMSYVTDATGEYRQAAVIAFNYAGTPIAYGPGSGSGIFLHYTPAGGATWGCVGLSSRSELIATLRWLDPAQHPVIVIR